MTKEEKPKIYDSNYKALSEKLPKWSIVRSRNQLLYLQHSVKVIIKEIENFIERHPNDKDATMTLLQKSLKNGFCFKSYFPSSEATSDHLLLFDYINTLSQYGSHLKSYLWLDSTQNFVLLQNNFNDFIEYLNSALFEFSKRSFDLFDNIKNYNLSEEDIKKILKVEDITLKPKVLNLLENSFNNPEYASILKLTSYSELYLAPLSNIVRKVNVQPDKTNLGLLHLNLIIISSILKKTSYYAHENGELTIDTLNFNQRCKLLLLYQTIYNIDKHYNYFEIDKIYDLYEEETYSQGENNMQFLIENPEMVEFWLNLSSLTGIDQYNLLFQAEFYYLFQNNNLRELNEVLNPEEWQEALPKFAAPYGVKDSPQYNLFQALIKSCIKDKFKSRLQCIDKLLLRPEIQDSSAKRKYQCVEVMAPETAHSTPLKKSRPAIINKI